MQIGKQPRMMFCSSQNSHARPHLWSSPPPLTAHRGGHGTHTHIDLQTGFGPRPQRGQVTERTSAPELLEQGEPQRVQEGEALALPGMWPPLLYTTHAAKTQE